MDISLRDYTKLEPRSRVLSWVLLWLGDEMQHRMASFGPRVAQVVLVVRCQSGLTRFDSHWGTQRSGVQPS